MKDLEKIIESLTKDEIRFYKLFIYRTNSAKNKSRKDEELFNFLKKSKHNNYSTKEILKKLSISNSNNYYQLKNRIYNDLNNSLTWQHISKDKQSSSFSYILLARVFKNRAELQLSFNYLLKAEKIAINEELYELLSIIYTEIIELSHELISIDIENYIKLKEYNINVDITDPWCSSEQAEHEYNLSLTEKPEVGAYDAIILAVSHNEFKAMGVDKIRALGKANHVLYDLKYVLPKESVDMRL